MNKLDELIQTLCPDGVEYKLLGEVCTIKTGKLNANAKKENGEYPFFTCDENPYKIDTYAFDTTAIIISGNGSKVGHVNKYSGKFNAYQRTYVLDGFNNISINFIYYYMKGFLREYINLNSKKGSVPYITLPMLQNFQIPVPPMEIQKEIVRLLDEFTAKTAELQAELNKEYEARKKQYEYYRDNLLNNNAEIPKIKLGEFAVISRGGNFQKKDFVDNGLPCIHYGQIYTHYGTYADTTLTTINEEAYSKSKKAKKNDIVMAVTSENIEDVCKSVAWLGDKDIAVSGHTAIISHHQNAKYLSYYFSSNAFFKQKKKLAHGTKVIEVTPNTLANIEVPLPSLEVQNRLVEVLDNFDSICSDLNIDLPAEIETRQKQYEYYRDSLLTFAETGHIMPQTDRQTDRQTHRQAIIRLVQYVFGYVTVELKDVVKIKNGKDYKHLKPGVYPVYGSGGVMTTVSEFVYDKPSVLIPRKGSLGNLYYVEEPFWNVDTIFYTEVNEDMVLPKYLFYLLQNEHLEKLNNAGGVPSLTQSVLNKVKLYIPSLDEQHRIVCTLDYFKSICSKLQSNISTELEARQKQYEYYRDKLLTFKELK